MTSSRRQWPILSRIVAIPVRGGGGFKNRIEKYEGIYIVPPAHARHYLGCKAGGPECVMFAVFSPDPTPK